MLHGIWLLSKNDIKLPSVQPGLPLLTRLIKSLNTEPLYQFEMVKQNFIELRTCSSYPDVDTSWNIRTYVTDQGLMNLWNFPFILKKSFPSTYWSKMMKYTVDNKEKIDRDCKIISNSIPFLTDSSILCDGEWEGGRDSWWYKKILHQQFLSVWLGRSSHSPGLVSRTGLVFVWISIG